MRVSRQGLRPPSNLSDVVSVQASRANLGLGYATTPADHGLIAWSSDPANIVGTTIVPTAGLVNVVRMKVPAAASVTNILMSVFTAGSGLTAGQNFAAIFQGGVLIGVTGDQSGVWNSIGTNMKTMALSGGPFPVTAGDVLGAFFSNGTTLPTFGRAFTGSAALINANIAGANARYGTADAGRTTTMPNPLGVTTNSATAWWMALS